jgi:hypothetical protein
MPSSVGIADTFPPDLGGRQGCRTALSLSQWDPSTTAYASAQDDREYMLSMTGGGNISRARRAPTHDVKYAHFSHFLLFDFLAYCDIL